MILYGVGMGPGDRGLVTLRALEVLREAQVVFEPLSAPHRPSVAGQMARDLVEGLSTVPVLFPMTGSECELRRAVRESLLASRHLWERAEVCAMPVIGDSALYATVHTLHQEMSSLTNVDLKLIPGISAHSAGACLMGSFIGMRDQVFSVVPGSTSIQRVIQALRACDCAALYKPSALKESLPVAIRDSGPWTRVARVHRVGLEGQRILEGEEAMEPTEDYLAVILLWR